MKNQNQAQSEEQTPAKKAKEFLKSISKPKFPKFLLILLSLVVLVLIGQGIYYFYLKQQDRPFLTDGEKSLTLLKINDPLLEEKKTKVGHGGVGYRVATDTYYHKDNSEKLVLLSVQGLVDEINYKKRFFYLKSEDVRRKLDFSVKDIPIYLVEYHPPDNYTGGVPYVPQTKTTPGAFEDISVGDIVTYNIPNEFSHIERLLIQKK